jgi:uncharacterized metal-binding protein YceD (DUF177 family)
LTDFSIYFLELSDVTTMLLPLHTLRSPHVVKLVSAEAWLQPVAADLAPSNPESANIQGEITLRTTSAGFVHASGLITAMAVQACSLCGENVTLALSASVKATYRPPYEGDTPKDMSLITEDLDVYFIERDGINLEVLVNDALQCAIPYQITCETSGLRPCDNGHLPSEESPKGARSGENSPFAILKTIK